jgi:hypothetical protein
MPQRDSVSGRSRRARDSAAKETTNSGRCQPWEESFELMKAYKEEHGHCVVPYRAEYRGVKLGSWVDKQRRRGKSGQMRNDRVALLNRIGFTWVAGEMPRPWDEWFELLKAYKDEHGHCRVLKSAEYRGFKLGSWVHHQRCAHKTGKLSEEQMARLNGIGFAWVVCEIPRSWDESFELLKAYTEEYGHCRVPMVAEYHGVKLGVWVRSQRTAHKSGKLSEEHVARLNGIGFTWVARESPRPWDESFELLKVYKEEHGHCRVNYCAEYRGVMLGGWVLHQRSAHKAGKLSENQRTRLDDIGFCWSPKRDACAASQSDTVARRTKRTRPSH